MILGHPGAQTHVGAQGPAQGTPMVPQPGLDGRLGPWAQQGQRHRILEEPGGFIQKLMRPPHMGRGQGGLAGGLILHGLVLAIWLARFGLIENYRGQGRGQYGRPQGVGVGHGPHGRALG